MVDIDQLEARIRDLEARVRELVPGRMPADEGTTHGCTHGCTGSCPDPTGNCTYGCTDACTNGCTDGCGARWQGRVVLEEAGLGQLAEAEAGERPSVELFQRLAETATRRLG